MIAAWKLNLRPERFRVDAEKESCSRSYPQNLCCRERTKEFFMLKQVAGSLLPGGTANSAHLEECSSHTRENR